MDAYRVLLPVKTDLQLLALPRHLGEVDSGEGVKAGLRWGMWRVGCGDGNGMIVVARFQYVELGSIGWRGFQQMGGEREVQAQNYR